MNQDFAIKWVQTPKNCTDCKHWGRKEKMCLIRSKGKKCPYAGRR